jgi:hypothetical protein
VCGGVIKLDREIKMKNLSIGIQTFSELIEKKYIYVDKTAFLDFEKIEASKAELGVFEVDDIDLKTILFQTGYLTIKEWV